MRGESRRVAERVRVLLGDDDTDAGGTDTVVADTGADATSPRPTSPRPTSPRPTPALLAAVLARVPVRLDPGRRGALAVGAAVLVAALITGAWLMTQRPRAMAVPTSGPSASATPVGSRAATAGSATAGSATIGSSAAGVGTGSPSSSAQQLVVVDVAGKVRRPGVYRLPIGSRVDDAIRRAGGALRGVDLSNLNLAAKLSDGVQIPVGVPGGNAAAGMISGGDAFAGAAGGSGGAAGGGVVDLNTAAIEQLQTLPGVGPVLAQNILDWRSAHGRFTSVDQLNDVTGIGDVKFAALKARVSI